MDTRQFRLLALPVTLAFALLAVAPAAFAQDTTADNDAETRASVPADRIADRYADTLFDGDEEAAADTVENLRKGGDLEVTNADGTTSTLENANGPMGYGEINIALGMAEKMVEGGDADTWQDALYGSADTSTPAGSDGILQMRADGMGWGQIARGLGFKLGTVVGKAPTRDSNDDATETPTTTAKADAHGSKPEHTKAEHPARPERVAKVERPTRPERVERPSKPERPQKPERGGRP